MPMIVNESALRSFVCVIFISSDMLYIIQCFFTRDIIFI